MVGFKTTELSQTKQNLKDHHKLSMFSKCYDSTDTSILVQAIEGASGKHTLARTHTHTSTVEETLPSQDHFSPSEWNRSRSKLINVPTAPERALVRWQQCLLTVSMNTNAEYYWILLL